MQQTRIKFYVVQSTRMTCTINIPDGVTPQEARDAIVSVSNESPVPPQYVLDAISAINAKADEVNGYVDWSDEDGIEIGNDHLFDQET